MLAYGSVAPRRKTLVVKEQANRVKKYVTNP